MSPPKSLGFDRPHVKAGRERRAVARTKTRLASLLRSLREKGWHPGAVAGWDSQQTDEWYGRLIESSTTTGNLALAAVCAELLYAHKPDTVRGNMYLVVSAGWLPDTGEESYDRVQRLLNRLRRSKVIPMEWVVDNIRQTIKPSSWSGLEDYADTIARAYRLDFWSRLSEYVEVIVEKDTIAGKLSQVTRALDVPLHPIRGYSSTTYAHNIARSWDGIEKPITVYYMGDHDPSGRNLEEDVCERLREFAERPFRWIRLGFNAEHFESYHVLTLSPKAKDSRTTKFVAEWGVRCAEIEAIPATELRRILREAIESHIPAGAWARLQRVEQIEKQQCREYLDGMFDLSRRDDEGGAS